MVAGLFKRMDIGMACEKRHHNLVKVRQRFIEPNQVVTRFVRPKGHRRDIIARTAREFEVSESMAARCWTEHRAMMRKIMAT